jgi:hypothetical protein
MRSGLDTVDSPFRRCRAIPAELVATRAAHAWGRDIYKPSANLAGTPVLEETRGMAPSTGETRNRVRHWIGAQEEVAAVRAVHEVRDRTSQPFSSRAYAFLESELS